MKNLYKQLKVKKQSAKPGDLMDAMEKQMAKKKMPMRKMMASKGLKVKALI